MTRIKRGYIARRRRTKMPFFVSSFQGAHSRVTQIIIQQRIRALFSAHRDKFVLNYQAAKISLPRPDYELLKDKMMNKNLKFEGLFLKSPTNS